MKTSRREFIKASSMMAAGTMIFPSLYCTKPSGYSSGSRYDPAPGIQIYSVRNQLSEDFKGTMKKVADIGYVNVEGYGLGKNGLYPGEIKPAEYRKVVEGVGMKLLSTHCSHFSPEETSMMLDYAHAAGFTYMIVGGLSVPSDERTIDTYKKAAEEFNRIGEKCTAAGIKFGYHNHAVEFEEKGGQIPMEVLIEETEPGLVLFEADLFWVTKGGYDPLKLVKKYGNRIGLFHVKEADADGEETTAGQGVINFKACFKAGRKTGLEGYFVEDERTEDPFGHVKADFDYIANQKFTKA
jgi:sugar phosphate isomerase/epimerase